MKLVTSEKLLSVNASVNNELAAWIKECDVLNEYDLVEVMYKFTKEIIEKNKLEIEPQVISRIMIYKDTKEEIKFLASLGVEEFRILPLLTEGHLKDYIEYRMDGRLGSTPIENGYNFFIVRDGQDEIVVDWTLEGDLYIDMLWEIACRVSMI